MAKNDALKGFWTKMATFFNKYLKDMLETYAPLIEIVKDEVITGKKTLVVRIENEYVGQDGEKKVKLGFYTLNVDVLPPTPVYEVEIDKGQ